MAYAKDTNGAPGAGRGRRDDASTRKKERDARLAAALRANLRRRKSAARAAPKDRDRPDVP